MEFCQYSVQDFFGENHSDLESIRLKLGAKEILRQSTEGLVYLHGLGFLHRNLHPSVFRIASYSDDIHQIKISDFRIAKNFSELFKNSAPEVKDGWIAPESLKLGVHLKKSVDVFVLGTYYYYVLSGGKHPFSGRTAQSLQNPSNGKKILFTIKDSLDK